MEVREFIRRELPPELARRETGEAGRSGSAPAWTAPRRVVSKAMPS